MKPVGLKKVKEFDSQVTSKAKEKARSDRELEPCRKCLSPTVPCPDCLFGKVPE